MFKRLTNLFSKGANLKIDPASQEHVVALRNVVKTYKTPAGEFIALKNMSLNIAPGEFVAVIGKSGSGKSTLINMVTGIDQPTLGEVHVAGAPLHSLSQTDIARWRGRNVGVVFQFFQLLPTLSLIENVMLPMEFCQLYTPKERLKRGMNLLDMVGLAEQAYKFPAAVSGGQQQRVAIARSLANDPALLIADEPTGSLDSKTGDAIFQLFENFVAQGRTILMVTHDRAMASRVSRVVYIADGEIVNEVVSEALPGLSEAQQVQVLSHLEPEVYTPGQVIIQQGDPAHTFYIITKGEAEVVIKHPDGQELIIAQLGVGQYFGEMGILEGGTRTATVRAPASGEVRVMQIDGAMFKQIQQESNLTGEQIAHLMRERAMLKQMAEALPTLTITDLKTISPELQMAHYKPGETIVKKGDVANEFYIIAQGEVEILTEEADGTMGVLARLSAGQYFGEIGILRGQNRTRTVRAGDNEVEVLALDRETFLNLYQNSQLTGAEIAQVVQQRLQTT